MARTDYEPCRVAHDQLAKSVVRELVVYAPDDVWFSGIESVTQLYLLMPFVGHRVHMYFGTKKSRIVHGPEKLCRVGSGSIDIVYDRSFAELAHPFVPPFCRVVAAHVVYAQTQT